MIDPQRLREIVQHAPKRIDHVAFLVFRVSRYVDHTSTEFAAALVALAESEFGNDAVYALPHVLVAVNEYKRWYERLGW